MGKVRLSAGIALAVQLVRVAAAQEACLDHCSLERAEDGHLRTICDCDEKRFPAPFFELRKKLPRRYANELRRRMQGAPTEDVAILAGDACARHLRVAATRARPANELRGLATIATLPLCSCVAARVHFPLHLECRQSRAGQQLCDPILDVVPSDRRGPARPASLFDFQSCVADRANYRKPETCEDVTCHDAPPVCGAGEEAVNVADPEACCPVFNCQGKDSP